MKKLLAILISFSVFSFSAVAEDGPYIGFKPSKLKIEWSTVDGVDLDEVYADEHNVMDFHAGYNLGNYFIELGYLNASDEGKSADYNLGGITISGSSSLEFDGWRVGTGYNYQLNDRVNLKPFLNYYEIDYDASLNVSVSGITLAALDTSGSESMIDAGLGVEYIINDKSKVGFSYSQSIDDMEDTDKVENLAINVSYQF